MEKLNLAESTKGIKFDFNCGVYRVVNLVTGDTYVGSSHDLKRRAQGHRIPSNHKRYPNRKLYQAINTFGRDNFEFQILEECSADSLVENEQKWINKLNPTYNITAAKSDENAWYKKDYADWPEEKKQRMRQQVSNWNKSHKEYYNSNLKSYYARTCLYDGHKYTYSNLVAKLRKLGVEHPNTEANKYVIIEEK